MRNKTYLHYLWQPFANFTFHLYIFDFMKVKKNTVWSQVFNIKSSLKSDNQFVASSGSIYFVKDHSINYAAMHLMRSKDNSVDIDDIVHETTHICDEFFQILEMKFGNEYGSMEYRSYLSGSIVSKICQILKHNGIRIALDSNDSMKLNNVLRVK